MPNKTQNYQLNQWNPDDDFLRTDFNEDNAKVDAAMAGIQTKVNAKCEIVTGTYVGDGSFSRTIILGFQPKALIVTSQHGATNQGGSNYGNVSGGLCLPGFPLGINNQIALAITSTGFTVSYAASYQNTNINNMRYHYVAVK